MKARLHLELRAADGAVLAVRDAHNTVMESGAGLVAALFSGTGGPVTGMGVGTSGSDADDVSVVALRNEPDGDVPALVGETVAALAPEAFSTRLLPERRVVQVRVRATLPPAAAVGTIREAGLVAQLDGQPAPVLYNRVVFAPVTKGDDHELTLFWDVDFPYGDLQWLA